MSNSSHPWRAFSLDGNPVATCVSFEDMAKFCATAGYETRVTGPWVDLLSVRADVAPAPISPITLARHRLTQAMNANNLPEVEAYTRALALLTGAT